MRGLISPVLLVTFTLYLRYPLVWLIRRGRESMLLFEDICNYIRIMTEFWDICFADVNVLTSEFYCHDHMCSHTGILKAVIL
jgi:hypothetical protein